MGSFFSGNKQEQEQAGYQVGQQLATNAVPKVNYNTANQFESSHTGWQGGQQGTMGTSIPQGPQAVNNGSDTMNYQPTNATVLGGSGSGFSPKDNEGPGLKEWGEFLQKMSAGGGNRGAQAQPMKLAQTGARGYNPIQGFGSVSQTGRW